MTETQELLRDTQIIVDLEKMKRNLQHIRALVGEETAIMAVIKANGYGHGAVGIAPALMDGGATYLAVATLSEALQLREAYPAYPLFILGHTPDRLLPHVIEKDITQTVFTLAQVQQLDALAAAAGKTAKVHLKVDTGFHRLGQTPSAAYADEICQMFTFKHVEIEGIFSHLALESETEDEKQFAVFTDFIAELEKRGCRFKYKHIADSIATVDYPRYRLNMIRPGAILYGMVGYHKGSLPLEQVMTFRTAISQLHELSAGEGLGYDYLWRAQRDSVVATLPFGYADGYPRNLRDKGYVIIGGVRCPIIGVICMDQCMADVTDVPGVCCGMEAIIYGDGRDGSMTIAEAALLADTNKNEILSRMTARPPRVYR